MGMTYKWKPQVSIPVDPQVAGIELENLRVRNNGRLTQEDVVACAEPEESPLHPAFEWNDRKAAEEYRLQQAGYMIRSITIAPESDGAVSSQPIRAFVNVVRDEDRSYTSVAHAMSDEDLRKQIIARAWKELDDWRARYNELVEFAKVFSLIEEERPRKSA